MDAALDNKWLTLFRLKLNGMLRLGGYLNLAIAIGHIIGLFWAKEMFEITGIIREMEQLATFHASFPYFLTVFVAIVFFLFGLYGLSASGKIKQLPWLKTGILTIAAIYLVRGLGEIVYAAFQPIKPPLSETLFSLIAICLGLLFLFGGRSKWKNLHN